MQLSLQDKFDKTSKFLHGVELVSVRGSMAEKSAVKARTFANQLVEYPEVDWISITDNAGGNPQLAPQALGKPILYAGKEVVIHLTCKDLNRNGLESEAWLLDSEGYHNILAMTGDYPVTGNGGLAKPVFDIDSVGLISMLNKMNHGFSNSRNGHGSNHKLGKTHFLIGAVTSNFKLKEGEVMPQYYKLEKKVECGAHFIINQIGYDARKMHELRLYMNNHNMRNTPLIGNVYVLNPSVAQLFNDKKIPGVVVTPQLLELCLKQKSSEDNGKAFFYELAAKQAAIYKGLGYRGVYLGGAYNFEAIQRIIEIEQSFGKDDWKEFTKELSYSQPNEFYYYGEKGSSNLSDPEKINLDPKKKKSKHVTALYRFSKWTHHVMFTPGKLLTRWGTALTRRSKDTYQGPALMRATEKLSKSVLFGCKDCGDCSLPNIAFLCPENHCAKNQRNGPCGGTKEGQCEVDGIGECIWLRAYERMKYEGKAKDLLEHAPVIQNQGLRRTSAWANNWLERDHFANTEHIKPPEPKNNGGSIIKDYIEVQKKTINHE